MKRSKIPPLPNNTFAYSHGPLLATRASLPAVARQPRGQLSRCDSSGHSWFIMSPLIGQMSSDPLPTFDILVLLSPVRKERLLISFCTTKFCSSRLKFCRSDKGYVQNRTGFVLFCSNYNNRIRFCTHTHTQIYIYIHTYTHIYTYSDTHTHTFW